MKQKFYAVLFLFFVSAAFVNTKAQVGKYNVTGYIFHPNFPRPVNQQKTITLLDPAKQIYTGTIGDVGDQFTFSIDATNHLVNFKLRDPNSGLRAGFMSADNPAGYPYYPDTTTGYTSDVYNNTYDSAAKTFYMHYGYNVVSEDTTVPFTRQIYEKWVLAPPPVTTWNLAGNGGFSGGTAKFVSIAFDASNLPYVVYQDEANGNKAMVMKLGANNTWIPVGSGAASDGAASFTNIAFDKSNIPYIAYIDSTVSVAGSITVRRFINGAWQVAGSKGFAALQSPGRVKVPIAFDGNGVPYVLSSRSTADGYVFSVNVFNGANWSHLGQDTLPFVSAAGDADIALDKKSNTVYVLSDNARDSIPGQAIVLKYSSNKWQRVGDTITDNANGIFYPNIEIDGNGKPLVAFQDDDGSKRVSVYKFDGVSWSAVGYPYFSSDNTSDISFALNKFNVPYVLFIDHSSGGQPTVMKYDSKEDNWLTVGTPGFATIGSFSPFALAISNNNTPYVAFESIDYGAKATVLHFDDLEAYPIRTIPGLYSEGDSASCYQWLQQYPDWTNLVSFADGELHLEMQTQFEDDPGNICGFQSYLADTLENRDTTWWAGGSQKQNIGYFPRNYRISFSNTPLPHAAGIRLFATTAELSRFIDSFNLRHGTSYTAKDIFVIRYDGPNEDYLLNNNEDKSSDYTRLIPSVHYFGADNEYVYFEFYTDRFSEFHLALSGSSVLPVTLLNFSATLHNGAAAVSWQTTQEVNTAFFTVQRGTDGIHFTDAGNVKASGTSGNHFYNYNDNVSGLSATRVYYRLVITDKDGSRRESSIASISLAGNTLLIALQPNPAHSYAIIRFSMEGKKTVTITDMNGRKVLVKTTANGTETINVSSFAKGLYLIRTEYANGYDVRKLLVE